MELFGFVEEFERENKMSGSSFAKGRLEWFSMQRELVPIIQLGLFRSQSNLLAWLLTKGGERDSSIYIYRLLLQIPNKPNKMLSGT